MEELTANLIADNMLSEVYSEKHHYQVLKNISDHSTDVRALKKELWILRSRERKHAKKTTIDWKLEIEWKDGTSSLIPFSSKK